MVSLDLSNLDLEERWSEIKPSIRFKTASPFLSRKGAQRSAAIYWELESGYETGLHKDNADELLLILAGVANLRVGTEKRQFAPEQLALIPAMMPHNIQNISNGAVRCLSFFACATVVSVFEKPLMPLGTRELHTGLIEAHTS